MSSTVFVVSYAIFAAILVVVGLTELFYRRRSKPRDEDTARAVLEIATIAERRHERVHNRRSTLIEQSFPELSVGAKHGP